MQGTDSENNLVELEKVIQVNRERERLEADVADLSLDNGEIIKLKEDLAKELREVRQFNDNYQKEKEEDVEKVNELQEKLRKPPI